MIQKSINQAIKRNIAKFPQAFCFKLSDDTIYHLGASLKDLGKKCFAISILDDKFLLEKIALYI